MGTQHKNECWIYWTEKAMLCAGCSWGIFGKREVATVTYRQFLVWLKTPPWSAAMSWRQETYYPCWPTWKLHIQARTEFSPQISPQSRKGKKQQQQNKQRNKQKHKWKTNKKRDKKHLCNSSSKSSSDSKLWGSSRALHYLLSTLFSSYHWKQR